MKPSKVESKKSKPVLAAILLIIIIQSLLLIFMIVNRQAILSSDITVILETRPIDPRSLFRGDYVRLNYNINNLQLDKLSSDRSFKINDTVYVILEQDGQYWAANAVYQKKPDTLKKQQHLIQGVVKTANVTSLNIHYGIENYFVPEGEGLKLERPKPGDKVTLEIALDKEGHAAIKALLLNGIRQYQEALF